MKLNQLIKITKKRKTIGRGGARGGTSGKGNKGQKARSGGFVKAQFEGGQTPLTRRIPRRGFNNKNFTVRYDIVSLDKIVELSQSSNIIDIDKIVLCNNNIIKKSVQKVKILLTKELKTQNIPALKISVDACSQSVKDIVEKAGGQVILPQ